jgi:3-methyladenine DNA glycosylase AlkD
VISKELRDAPARFVIGVARELVASGGGKERFVAYELILKHPAALAAVNARTAVALASTLADWAAVDTFACYIAGPAWRERQIADTVIRQWAVSRDRWWRRAAVVCTVALNNKARGGRGDPRRTIDICRRVIADRDDMVVKALSWALRELAKRDPAAARAFVTAHETHLAPRVRREVANKLNTGRKHPRR